jgi:hypothetical protein
MFFEIGMIERNPTARQRDIVDLLAVYSPADSARPVVGLGRFPKINHERDVSGANHVFHVGVGVELGSFAAQQTPYRNLAVLGGYSTHIADIDGAFKLDSHNATVVRGVGLDHVGPLEDRTGRRAWGSAGVCGRSRRPPTIHGAGGRTA